MIRELTNKIWLLACLIIGCWVIFMQTPIKETLNCTQGQCTCTVYYIFKRPVSSGLDMDTLADKKLTVHYQIQRRLMNYYEIAYPQDKYYYQSFPFETGYLSEDNAKRDLKTIKYFLKTHNDIQIEKNNIIHCIYLIILILGSIFTFWEILGKILRKKLNL